MDHLSLGMLAHRASRVLLVGKSCAEPIQSACTSGLAGCTFSISISKTFLWEAVRACKVDYEQLASSTHDVNQHVVGLGQLVIGDTEDTIAGRCVRKGACTFFALTRGNLEISSKIAVAASSKKVAERIATSLQGSTGIRHEHRLRG